jgi:hypothetical protein
MYNLRLLFEEQIKDANTVLTEKGVFFTQENKELFFGSCLSLENAENILYANNIQFKNDNFIN